MTKAEHNKIGIELVEAGKGVVEKNARYKVQVQKEVTHT